MKNEGKNKSSKEVRIVSKSLEKQRKVKEHFIKKSFCKVYLSVPLFKLLKNSNYFHILVKYNSLFLSFDFGLKYDSHILDRFCKPLVYFVDTRACL